MLSSFKILVQNLEDFEDSESLFPLCVTKSKQIMGPLCKQIMGHIWNANKPSNI